MLLAASRSFKPYRCGIVTLGVYDSDIEVLSKISMNCIVCDA
jgi:hypothetical protein